MKRTTRITALLFAGFLLALSAGCASGPRYSGFLGDYYKNLGPGREGGAKLTWLNPGADLKKYNKVMIDSVIFFFADDSDYKGIDPQTMKDLADAFNLELVNALKDRYTIVADPGPGVVRLRFAITGVSQSRPVQSAVSSIIPAGLAISAVKKGVGGSWSGSGAVSAEFMAVDSKTNQVLVIAVDEKTAGFTDRFSKWGSADEAFKFWAHRVRLYMDEIQAAKGK